MDRIFAVNSFSKTYGKRTVLTCPSMKMESGKTYAIVGANGSGKSTFAKVVAGILPSDQGKMAAREAESGKSLRIGYLPQKPYAFCMSVRRNLRLNTGKHTEVLQKSEVLMQEMGLNKVSRSNAKHLSGGENAKMALARLLVREYDLLILDEPTAAMDIHSARHTEELLKKYQKNTSCCMIVVTHSLKQAHRMADLVCFFKDGFVIETGKADQILYQPQKQETKEFLDFYDL